MKYNRLFQQAYDRIGTSVPIDRFAKIINPRALGLETRDEFYAPIRFNVQVAHSRSKGVVTLDVPVHGNAEWYQDMQEGIAGMLGGKTEYADVIRFKTVTGEDLADIPLNKMRNVGTLNMFVNGQLKRLKNVDHTNMPIEYSVTKDVDLKHWYKDVSEALPEVIACELNKCCKPHELDDAISEGSVVQQVIEKHLINAASPQEWSEFVRTHHVRSPKKLGDDVAEAVLQDVSTSILGFIRAHVKASSENIRAYMRHAGASGETKLNAPIVSAVSSPMGGEHNGMDMYRRMVDGAVITPALEQNVIRIIHTDSPALKKQRRERVGAPNSVSSSVSDADHHPWNAHVHHMLKPLKGAYPSDYLARHVHQDMRDSAYYAGEPVKAYQAYHLFRGYHGAPPGVAMKGGRPVGGELPLIEKCPCSSSSKKKCNKKKKKKKTKSVDEEYTPLDENVSSEILAWQSSKMIPIKNGAPDIVPIEAHCSKRGPHCKKQAYNRDSDDEEYSEKYYDERLMESECPQVIPINSAVISDDEDEVDSEFSHLPQVADIFKD